MPHKLETSAGNVLLSSNHMDNADERVVLGNHGKNVMAGIFRQRNGEWLALHEPFVIPRPVSGPPTFDTVLNHPALRDKFQRGAQLEEFLVGDNTTSVTPKPQKVPEAIALFHLARANGVPAFAVASQTIVVLDLAANSVTAGVVEGDAEGIRQIISNEVWAADQLPAAWNVASSILDSVAPKELQQDKELLSEVQRQVDAYLQERNAFDQTPEMELVLPRRAPYGKVTFTIPDTVFEQAVAAMKARLETEIQGRFDHQRPVFLFVTGERANWPGMSEFTLPGHVIPMVAPSQGIDPLALGAVLSAVPTAPSLAFDASIQALHGESSADLITLGSPLTSQPTPQELKVKFSQSVKDKPVEATLTLNALQADGTSRQQHIHLSLPPQGQGWKIFQRGETPLATQEVTLSIGAEMRAAGRVVRLTIKMSGNREAIATGDWQHQSPHPIHWYEVRVFKVKA